MTCSIHCQLIRTLLSPRTNLHLGRTNRYWVLVYLGSQHSSWVISLQIGRIRLFTCSLLTHFSWRTRCLSMFQMPSWGFRSGDWAGCTSEEMWGMDWQQWHMRLAYAKRAIQLRHTCYVIPLRWESLDGLNHRGPRDLERSRLVFLLFPYYYRELDYVVDLTLPHIL